MKTPRKLFALALWVALLSLHAPVSLGVAVVGSISRPDLIPRAVAVYEAGNKVFVADDATGNVYVYHGTTLAELGAVFVGKFVTDMAVHEGTGRLYVASLEKRAIGVVDAETQTLVRYLEGNGGYINLFSLSIDEPLGKVYALSWDGLTQIDVFEDTETLIPGFGGGGYEGIGVNPVTHEVFVTRYLTDELVVVDGVTHEKESISGLGGAGQKVGVNTRNNKAYVGYCDVLSNGRLTMCVYDRVNNAAKIVGAPNDSVDLFYNPRSNRVYSTVEVDQVATIIDGETDAWVNLPMSGASGSSALLIAI